MGATPEAERMSAPHLASQRGASARRLAGVLAFATSAAAFLVLLFGNLSHPLLWNDEGETAMYAERILDFGFPKVHDGKNVVYELPPPSTVATKEGSDAYVGSPWGQYYYATLGALWARGTPDIFEKTFRMRLPFAVAGAAGVFLWLLALLRLFPKSARPWVGATYLFLLCGSTWVVLHLREARHYPLALLLVASLLFLHVGRIARPASPQRGYAASLAVLLFLLFNVFPLPFAAMAAMLGIGELLLPRPGEGSALARAWQTLVPVAVAGVGALVVATYFEMGTTAAHLKHSLLGLHFSFFEHLRVLLGVLHAHAFLAAALVAKIAAMACVRSWPEAASDELARARQATSDRLWLLVVAWFLTTAWMPLSYERYVLPLAPVLVGALLLDGSAVLGALRSRTNHTLGLASCAGFLVALVAVEAATFAAKGTWLVGRMREIASPYQGPLDLVVPWILTHSERPSELVIATNYESTVLMYYLGSRVTVGFARANMPADLETQPDLILPRATELDRGPLARLASRAAYEEVVLPVADLPCNNVPQLLPSRFDRMTHRFATEAPSADRGPVRLYRLRSSTNLR